MSGTYSYPTTAAGSGASQPPGFGIGGDNAADIFRIAVGNDRRSTYWRVDWNTLMDPRHPVAVFGVDIDRSAATGSAEWPGVPGLTSPGVDRVLLVSSRGAWLDGRRVADTAVDGAARSFVVALPRDRLEPTGTARVRVVAGVANEAGDGLRPIGPELGAAPGQPPVFNVSFRRSDQEMAKLRQFNGAKVRGLYTDRAQAEALTTGDVSGFFADIPWNELARRRTTPEPFVRGPSNRWYVSSIELGQGVVNTYGGFSDGLPNLLGRVQPYTVWIPEDYDARGRRPAPLTLMIHPNGSTHNEYIDSPRLMQAACERPVSICVTFAGRSPDQSPAGEMELDFWEVWSRVASTFAVDLDRTRLFAFSQGGGVANHLAMSHPDLFARVAVFAPGCCGDTNQVANLEWVPIFIGEPTADPTIPDAVPEMQRLNALGYRHRFELYPGDDHVSFGYKDRYARGALYLGDGTARRMEHPPRVTYVWSHEHDRPDLGFTVDGAYWVRRTTARDRAVEARVDAVSHARPAPAVTPVTSSEVVTVGDPPVALATEMTWREGGAAPTRKALNMRLTNVAALDVHLAGAGFKPGDAITLDVVTDGPTVMTFDDGAGKRRVVELEAGEHHVTL